MHADFQSLVACMSSLDGHDGTEACRHGVDDAIDCLLQDGAPFVPHSQPPTDLRRR